MSAPTSRLAAAAAAPDRVRFVLVPSDLLAETAKRALDSVGQIRSEQARATATSGACNAKPGLLSRMLGRRIVAPHTAASARMSAGGPDSTGVMLGLIESAASMCSHLSKSSQGLVRVPAGDWGHIQAYSPAYRR